MNSYNLPVYYVDPLSSVRRCPKCKSMFTLYDPESKRINNPVYISYSEMGNYKFNIGQHNYICTNNNCLFKFYGVDDCNLKSQTPVKMSN